MALIYRLEPKRRDTTLNFLLETTDATPLWVKASSLSFMTIALGYVGLIWWCHAATRITSETLTLIGPKAD